MTETEFVLMQEKIDNLEGYCLEIDNNLNWYKENNTSSDWLEKRVIALEEQVRMLIHRTNPHVTTAQKRELTKLWIDTEKRKCMLYTLTEEKD